MRKLYYCLLEGIATGTRGEIWFPAGVNSTSALFSKSDLESTYAVLFGEGVLES